MKNEFKSGYTYTTKDGGPMLCLSILETMMLFQSRDGAILEYHLDGTCMATNSINGKHSSHLDLVPGLFSREDAFKEMKLGKRVQNTDWLDENGGKHWFYRLNNRGDMVDEEGDVVTDFDELSDCVCWQVYDYLEPEALENLCYENKNMAEFLEFLGFNNDQIVNIALAGLKPKGEMGKAKGYLQAKTSDFSEATLEILYNQNADLTPVDPTSMGHIFTLKTLENMCCPEFYDEEDMPSNEAFLELKKVIDALNKINGDMLYLTNK